MWGLTPPAENGGRDRRRLGQKEAGAEGARGRRRLGQKEAGAKGGWGKRRMGQMKPEGPGGSCFSYQPVMPMCRSRSSSCCSSAALPVKQCATAGTPRGEWRLRGGQVRSGQVERKKGSFTSWDVD